ncbi:MAG: aromatic ring-hydroxylating dioxygenase subunit alpha [Gemmatimonadaceae bacterium]
MPAHFPFDPHLANASTIPSRLYNDPVYLELELGQVFAKTWQLVGRTEHLAATGSYLTAEIAGENIVVLRDGDALRGYHNVCLHRAGPVASGCGKRQTMQCKYHGWTYNLRGELLRAPDMETTENFRAEDFRLKPVQVASWGPLVFANLDLKAPSLSHFLEDIPARCAAFKAEQMRYVMSKEWRIECNWKVYIDNYLEGYHVSMVHPGLHKELDIDNYVVETHRYYSRQFAPLRAVEPHATDRKYVPREGDDEAHYYWIYPNWMLNIYQGQLQTNVVLPIDHRTTLVRFDWYAVEPPAEADPTWTKLVAFSDEIQDEDIGICEAVQRNLRSRVYDRGRYSAKRENGVHHFHGLLHEALT